MSESEPTARSEPAFDAFLAQVGRALPQRPEQSVAVTDELRDHLEERLAELLERGVPRETAVQTAIDELGDAAALAGQFNTVSRDLRRRWIMRYATATVAAAVLVLLVTAAFWPNTPTAPLAPQATAQEATPPATEAAAAKPRATSKEANNTRTEQLLAAHRVKADIKEMPLREFFFEYLRQLKTEEGKTVELQAFVKQKNLEEANVTLDTPIALHLASVRLDMLLKLVLSDLGLGYYVDDGIIIVTSKDAVDTRMEVRVYNCRDLLQLPRMKRKPGGPGAAAGAAGTGDAGGAGAAAPGGGAGGLGGAGGGGLGGGGFGGPIEPSGYDVELIDVLRTNVVPDTWKVSGGPGDVAEYRGILVVTQTADVHRQIEELLEMLRLSAAKEPPATR